MILTRTQIETLIPVTADDTRWALNAVNVSVVGDRMKAEATNGHLALTVTEPITPDCEWPIGRFNASTGRTVATIIPGFMLSAALKTMPKKATIPVLATVRIADEGGKAVVQATDLESQYVAEIPADLTYPDTARVYVKPDAEIVARLTLSREMLTNLVKSLGAFHEKRKDAAGGSITIEIPCDAIKKNDDERQVIGPVRLRATHGDRELTGVMMGMRI